MVTSLSCAESALISLQDAPATASQLVQHTCKAQVDQVLGSHFVHRLLRFERPDARQGAVKFGIDQQRAQECDQLELLSVGVAALHAFAQVNWTGPALEFDALAMFDQSQTGQTSSDELNEAAIDALTYRGEPAYHLTHSAAFLVVALQIFGLLPSPFDRTVASDATTNGSSLLDNKTQEDRPLGSIKWTNTPSIGLWRLRAGLVWIKVLDEPVPLAPFVAADATRLRNALPLQSSDRARVSLSLSLLASTLSRSSPHSTAQKEASTLARAAADEEGLEWELTGRLGKRTKFQVDEKTQLVVLAKDRTSNMTQTSTDAQAKVPEALALNDDTLLERTAFSTADGEAQADDKSPAANALSMIDPADQPHVSSFSQSVLLSLSLLTIPYPTSLVHLSADVLSTSQVSAFVSRVLQHPQNWSVHSMALLLRCRAEAGRSRTVERGVLQMQALVDQLRDGTPTQVSALSSAVKTEDMAPAHERLSEFHSLALPPAWEMERELATRYLSLGITKSALEIFTRLEMWEDVARCWASLERPDKGIAVIKDLLSGGKTETEEVAERRKGAGAAHFRGGEKREAKLWCTLGDLEKNAAHYEKAWDLSGHTSSRAQRSLGAVHWANQDYEAVRTSLRLALRINPLFPRTWFLLGCAEMRLEDWAGAQDAFGRCVALEDDDAESWSNLASCHLRRGETEGDADPEIDLDLEEIEGGVDSTGVVVSTASINDADDLDQDHEATVRLPFSRKRAAFHCLKQAIKYSYESWRMWYNYMIVAVDVGEMSEACRALGRITEMRVAKEGEAAIDLDVLDRLIDAVTKPLDDEGHATEPAHVDPNYGKGLLPRVDHLIKRVILPHVSNSPRVFIAHSRLYMWSGDYAGALDCHLKAYRAGVAADSTVEHDKAKFVEAAQKVEDVVVMLENLGPKRTLNGEEVAKDWKYQARSLVRTFLGRTKDAFEDEPEYEKLKEVLQDLK
ncbi:hypothetical protein OIO90_003726 [Microbotryomycetes sp. JL221]|nr:hypothetical protein OIO90_003726 [Microbotryomycetes sp. JL221]